MSRLKVDLQQMNQRRMSILVAEIANADRIRDYFLGQGFFVEITTDASELYSRLCEASQAPGYVLISMQAEGAMARMMPDFVVRRFNVPVLLFLESPTLPVHFENSPEALPAEIMPVGEIQPDQLLKTLETFEETYKVRVASRKGLGEETSQFVSSFPRPKPVEANSVGSGEIPEDVLKILKSAFQESQDEVEVGDDDVLTLHACKVVDPSSGGRGYFVFAFPVRGPDHQSDQALVILESRVREAVGADADAAIEHLVQAVPGPFFREVMKGSDEVVTGLVGNQEMILAYFRNRSDIDEPEARVVDEHFLVPVEEWWTRLPLPCHAYVWLELNQKRVLYVRPGDRLRPEGMTRLRNKGVNHLAVEPSDFNQYRKIREMVHVSRAGDRFRLAAA